jgi:hypothetical protein
MSIAKDQARLSTVVSTKIKKKLKASADKNRRSMSAHIAHILEEYLKAN